MVKEITAINPQKRNPQRVSIYLDGEFAFGLSCIVAAWLKVGRKLTDAEIAQLQAQDTYEVAYQRALHFISFRPRSTAEVEKKLTEAGFDPAVIETTCQKLRDNHWLDDLDFARQWIDNRNTFRPRSQRLLMLELRQKGIAEAIIQKALITSAQDEEEMAYQAAFSRIRRYADLDWQTFRKKIGDYLLRRGFSYAVIAPVLKRLWETCQANACDTNNGNMEQEDGMDE